MRAKSCFVGTLALAAVFLTNSPPPAAATARVCAGSPLAIEDNIGEIIQHGVRSVRSAVTIAEIHAKVGGRLVGWLYTDDAGYLSVILQSANDGAAFGGQKVTGPFLQMKGLPRGFAASACS